MEREAGEAAQRVAALGTWLRGRQSHLSGRLCAFPDWPAHVPARLRGGWEADLGHCPALALSPVAGLGSVPRPADPRPQGPRVFPPCGSTFIKPSLLAFS